MNATLNIAKLVAVCQKIEGRKKLQKIVHILQCCGFGAEFPQQFGYLHYGPYSHEVKADIDMLVSPEAGFVEERESTAGLGHRSFVYAATERLRTALPSQSSEAWEGLAESLNSKSAQDLEAISTVFFLKNSGSPSGQIRERFSQLKPALISRFESASAEVDRLSSESSARAVLT